MRNNQPEISFFAEKTHIDAFPAPRPAQKFFPDYFVKLKPQASADPRSGTVKRCVPFLDALSLGYIIPLWADVMVTAYNGEIKIEFPENLPMKDSLSSHTKEQIKGHPLSNAPYGNIPLKFHNPWGIQTPKGWSVLITSPLNHLEQRFKILDGVVDTDEYYNQINFPFIWTGGDGEFYLPKGTPIAQVIPIKRQKFCTDVCAQDDQKVKVVSGKLGTVFRNAYRTMFWNKREGVEK